jgi:hypothetical protein
LICGFGLAFDWNTHSVAFVEMWWQSSLFLNLLKLEAWKWPS